MKIPAWIIALVAFSILSAQIARADTDLTQVDGTVTYQEHGYATIIDLQCHIHRVRAGIGQVIVNGSVFRQFLKLPMNVRAVLDQSDRQLPSLISVTSRSSGAPRNCSVYSSIRTLDGFLKQISQGNAAGNVDIEADTGDTVSFTFQAGNPSHQINFFGHPFPGCSIWPEQPCPDIPGLRSKMRVRAKYTVEMIDGERHVKLLSVDAISTK